MDLIKILDQAIENQKREEKRNYIGASSIGKDCKRAIWYAYNQTETSIIPARIQRIFETGKRLETMILDYFELAGFKVLRPKMGDSGIPCFDKDFDFFKGNMDGIIYLSDKIIAALEIKTAKESEFNKFVNLGLNVWNGVYFAQVQSYMGMHNLKYAIFFVICKNTSRWHYELIEFDEIYYCELKAKAKMIHDMTDAPERLNANPCFWICKMCQYKEICHK